jgi:hypothetical protein
MDIDLLLTEPLSPLPTHRHYTRSTSIAPLTGELVALPSYTLASSSASNKRSTPAHPAESRTRMQRKWLAEEDNLMTGLRVGGMKWKEISKRLPGRSATSCRLHYHNYLERSEWNEERKNKLAILYEK